MKYWEGPSSKIKEGSIVEGEIAHTFTDLGYEVM
jgi:hypothetical protein